MARDGSGETDQLILRLDRSGALESTLPLEGRCLNAAASTVPVPTVIAAGEDLAGSGAPYLILERVDGETIPRRLLRDERFAGARPKLLGQVVNALAQIHAIDPETIEGLGSPDPLVQWADVLHQLGEPHPALEIAYRYLVDNRPEPSRHTLVHGDYRLGNLLVDESGLRSVLDWELAHAGDPVEDLGWMCVRAWRFGSPEPALGFGSYDELLEQYEAETGVAVEPAALSWWETCGTWRWGVMCALMAAHGKAAGRLTVELAAIGRRACENEWDVLSCLERAGLRSSELPPAEVDLTARPPALHDAPTSAELVRAVREYIDGEARPATTGPVSFHGRIASNVLATVERELLSAFEQTGEHTRLLKLIGAESPGALAKEIRDGARPYDDPLQLAVVGWEVASKLAVAHPGYELDGAPPGASPPSRSSAEGA